MKEKEKKLTQLVGSQSCWSHGGGGKGAGAGVGVVAVMVMVVMVVVGIHSCCGHYTWAVVLVSKTK
jgi:hypothetical protein